jgi:hypothetical protein
MVDAGNPKGTHTVIKKLLTLGLMLSLTTSAKAEFFINPFAGMMVFDSTVTVGTTKLVDQGGDAIQGGVRLGWINNQPGLHYGVEADGLLASGRSRAVIPPDIYSYSIHGGLGAYGRLGWRTNGNSIMFLRAGVQFLNTNQGWETLPAIGAGAEIPFAPNWAVRLDLTYAWDRVEFYNGTVGVVWRF